MPCLNTHITFVILCASFRRIVFNWFSAFNGKSFRIFFPSFCFAFALLLIAASYAEAQKFGKKKHKDGAIVSSGSQFRAAEEALVIDGMKFMAKGETDRALPIFEELVELDPKSGTAHYLLASAQVKLNKPEGSESAKKAYELDPDNVYFGKFLAENLARQKKYGEAAVIYEEVLQLDPANLQTNIELAAAYVFSDQLDKAIETYDKLEKNIGITEEVIKQKQQLYLRQNKLDSAIEEAQKLIDSEPSEAFYYIELAELYIEIEMLEKAKPVLQEALRINPDEAQAHILLADIYRRNGELEKCNEELRLVFKNPNFDVTPKIRVMSGYLEMLKNDDERSEVLELIELLVETHPADAKPLVLYADQLAKRNEKAKARDAYVRAARIDGSVYEIWGAIMQLDGELSQFDSLITHSEMALEFFPNQGMLWYSNGSANMVRKNYPEAISALEESRKLMSGNPTLMRYIHAQLGDAYNQIDAHEKSDAAYEFVLKEDPENDHVLNNYSYFLSLRKENLGKAREMSSKLVEKHPDNATYLDTHAWVLYMQKDYKGARVFLEKALENPANVSSTIVEHYGDVLSKLGEKDLAIEQWKKARDMGEKSDTIDKKIASGIAYD